MLSTNALCPQRRPSHDRSTAVPRRKSTECLYHHRRSAKRRLQACIRRRQQYDLCPRFGDRRRALTPRSRPTRRRWGYHLPGQWSVPWWRTAALLPSRRPQSELVWDKTISIDRIGGGSVHGFIVNLILGSVMRLLAKRAPGPSHCARGGARHTERSA